MILDVEIQKISSNLKSRITMFYYWFGNKMDIGEAAIWRTGIPRAKVLYVMLLSKLMEIDILSFGRVSCHASRRVNVSVGSSVKSWRIK